MNAAAVSADGLERRSARRLVGATFGRYALLVILAVLFLAFAILPATRDSFLSLANLRALVGNQAVIAVIALASVIPLIVGQIDLSVAPIAGLCGLLVAGVSAHQSAPLGVAILMGILAGVAAGIINGILIAYLGVGSIIATLGMATVIQAVVSLYSNNQTIVTGIPEMLIGLGNGNFLNIPFTVWVVIVLALVLAYVLGSTPFGRHLYFIGNNQRAALLVGLPVKLSTLASFVIAGALGAVAGMMQVGVAGSASPQVGPNFTLPALAAAFLGATVIRPGNFNVLGTLIAVLFVAVTVNGLTLLGAADWLQPAVNGVSLLVAVTVGQLAILRARKT